MSPEEKIETSELDRLHARIAELEQTAAERVIADGSRGPTPDYTGEGSAWVPAEPNALRANQGGADARKAN